MTRRDKHKYRVIKKYLQKRCKGIGFISSGLLCIGVSGQFELTEHGKCFVEQTEPKPIIFELQRLSDLKEHRYSEPLISIPKHEEKEYRNRMKYAKYQKYRK